MSKFVPNPAAMRKLERASHIALGRAAVALQARVQDLVVAEAADTGSLAKSYAARPVADGRWRVGSNLIQAWAVEYGRTPGLKAPPVEALVGWAVRHGIVRGDKTQGIDGVRKKDRGVVYAIARAIGKKGSKGRHLLERAKREAESDMRSVYISSLRSLL